MTAALSILVGVSSFLGLLSVIVYLFTRLRMRHAHQSARSIIEGEGLFNSEQVVRLLGQFQDDTSRLEALRALTHVDLRKAQQVLNKVKENLDISTLASGARRTELTYSLISAVFFIAVAALGLTYSLGSQEIQRQEAQRQEAQRQEAQRQEAQRQEAQRQAARRVEKPQKVELERNPETRRQEQQRTQFSAVRIPRFNIGIKLPAFLGSGVDDKRDAEGRRFLVYSQQLFNEDDETFRFSVSQSITGGGLASTAIFYRVYSYDGRLDDPNYESRSKAAAGHCGADSSKAFVDKLTKAWNRTPQQHATTQKDLPSPCEQVPRGDPVECRRRHSI